jgi:hypothetical protein
MIFYGCSFFEQQPPVVAPQQKLEPWQIEAIAFSDAQKLFSVQCSLCHCDPNVSRCEVTMKDLRDRAPQGDWIYRFLSDEELLMASGDTYVLQLRESFNTDSLSGGYVHSFKNLTHEQIDGLLNYVDGKPLTH